MNEDQKVSCSTEEICQYKALFKFKSTNMNLLSGLFVLYDRFSVMTGQIACQSNLSLHHAVIIITVNFFFSELGVYIYRTVRSNFTITFFLFCGGYNLP